MAPISQIRSLNAAFAAQKHTNKVCVFVGATNGIGQSTLKTVSTLLAAPTIYVVGRSASRWETQRRQDLSESDAKFVFIEADVSTIKGVDKACEHIREKESRIDYLSMSPGYFPLIGQIATSEGLEQCMTLSYWARIRFLHNLLPALQQSPAPRVMSIFAAGGETKALREDDMGLTKNWTIPNFAHQAAIMKTLVFHHFLKQSPNLTLIHAWPGFVLTGKERKPKPDASANILWRWGYVFLRDLGRVIMSLRAIPEDESGQRHAYLLTNEEKAGPGVWRFNEHCETFPQSQVLEKEIREGKSERVWEFTAETWERALGVNRSTST